MRDRFLGVGVLTLLYYAVPGHPDLPTHGLPLGPIGTVIVTLVALVTLLLRRAPLRRTMAAGAGTIIVVSMMVRAGLSAGAVPEGWAARYYASERSDGQPEWSSEYRRADITRIDRQIAFRDTTFPAHYLNDYQFERGGDRREVTEPMSAHWAAHARLDAEGTVRVSLAARGMASVSVDDRVVADIDTRGTPGRTSIDLSVPTGDHQLAVRYLKPPHTDGLIEVTVEQRVGDQWRPLDVSPEPASREAGRRARRGAVATESVVVATFLAAAAAGLRQALVIGSLGTSEVVAGFLAVFFGAQGVWHAGAFAGRVVPFNSGDDWFGFESSAREILRHGLLMPMGRPLGEGEPYFYHPFYCYFLAAVHAVTGEDLFGPVFAQFLILAAVAWLIWRLMDEAFGSRPGAAALIAVILLFQLDFIRYYTVTLLSENLYILTVTLTLVHFARWIQSSQPSQLRWSAFWGGVSTITRPPMLLFLIPALIIVALRSRSAARVAALATIWLAAIAPVTLRNALVARRFVPVSDVPLASVLTYNIPPSLGVAEAAEYLARFDGTVASLATTLALMVWEHPVAMIGLQLRKLGFSLGMIHWGAGYRPHPELVAVSALYLLWLGFDRRLRQPLFWPIHAFVACHLISMSLTQPWNYGYRLILPPFVYTTGISAAATMGWLLSRRSNASARVASRA